MVRSREQEVGWSTAGTRGWLVHRRNERLIGQQQEQSLTHARRDREQLDRNFSLLIAAVAAAACSQHVVYVLRLYEVLYLGMGMTVYYFTCVLMLLFIIIIFYFILILCVYVYFILLILLVLFF